MTAFLITIERPATTPLPSSMHSAYLLLVLAGPDPPRVAAANRPVRTCRTRPAAPAPAPAPANTSREASKAGSSGSGDSSSGSSSSESEQGSESSDEDEADVQQLGDLERILAMDESNGKNPKFLIKIKGGRLTTLPSWT